MTFPNFGPRPAPPPGSGAGHPVHPKGRPRFFAIFKGDFWLIILRFFGILTLARFNQPLIREGRVRACSVRVRCSSDRLWPVHSLGSSHNRGSLTWSYDLSWLYVYQHLSYIKPYYYYTIQLVVEEG